MRWIGCAMLCALLVLGVVALRPAHAARTLDCRPGSRHSITGVGPPRTALLLLFDGAAIGGGTTSVDGAYRIPLVVGAERPGVYSVDVVRRDNRSVIDSATCIVPAPDAQASPRSVVTNAPAPTAAVPPTAVSTADARVIASPTGTRTPTVSPLPTTTSSPGASSPTITPTSSATPSPSPALSPTSSGSVELTLDDLDPSFSVDDDIDVSGSLVDANEDGITNVAVTVRYTLDNADAGVWCSTTTNSDGDWECPTKTVPASWLNKKVRITVSVSVQGSSFTAAGEFTITSN